MDAIKPVPTFWNASFYGLSSSMSHYRAWQIVMLIFCLHHPASAETGHYVADTVLQPGKAIIGLDWACGGCIFTKTMCCQEEEIICLLPSPITPTHLATSQSPGRKGDWATGLSLRLRPQSYTASSVSHTQLVHAMQSDVGGRQSVDMKHNKQMYCRSVSILQIVTGSLYKLSPNLNSRFFFPPQISKVHINTRKKRMMKKEG